MCTSIHNFKSDLISNMDNMRISGIKPSSVILSQTKWFQKLRSDAQKVPKQTVQFVLALFGHQFSIARSDGEITHKITNSPELVLSPDFWISNIPTNQSKSAVELATCALGDSPVHQQWHSLSSWYIKRDFYSDVYIILNRILLTLWTYAHFWYWTPHQWSLAKEFWQKWYFSVVPAGV